MSTLKVDVKPCGYDDKITVLAFSGNMDTGSISNISNSFELILERHTPCVIADMTNVSAISSAALGEMMGGRKLLLDNNGELVFAHLSRDIKTKLTLMGANKIFRFFSDVRSAVSSLQWEFQDKSEDITLSFPALLTVVPAVRQLASRVAKMKGYNRRDSFRIETIVDEICNNAVEHGNTDSHKNIEMSICIDRRKVDVNVINSSNPEKLKNLKKFMNPSEVTEEELESDFRGRGLALIKLLSNDLDIDFSENGTRVRATKLKEE